MSDGMLIDEKGRVWPDHSWEVARRVGYRHASLDLPGFAVQERGFIHIRPQEGGVRVALRTGRFTGAALARLLYLLRDRPPRHILLAVLNDADWSYDMFVSLWELAERLDGLIVGAPPSTRTRWVALERDVTGLATRTFARVRPMHDLWRARRGRLDQGVFDAIDTLGLRERVVLARYVPDSSRLVFEHFGAGITMLRPCETILAVGQDLETVPDAPYGAWVGQDYRETLATEAPHFHSVRAEISTSQATELRVRYDRLLLPWRDRTDRRFALAISLRISAFCRPIPPPVTAGAGWNSPI